MRPIDRVDRDQTAFPAQEALVGKTGLNHILTIIEIAFDGDIVDIITQHRGHLFALHFGHPIVRMHDKDIDEFGVLTTFDGGRAGITGGGANYHGALIALGQDMIEQATEQLQCKILKR